MSSLLFSEIFVGFPPASQINTKYGYTVEVMQRGKSLENYVHVAVSKTYLKFAPVKRKSGFLRALLSETVPNHCECPTHSFI
jgi:hypothetical protein